MTSWKYAWTSPYLANASPKALIMLVKRSWSGYDLFDILSSGFDILSFSFDILLWVLISYYGFWYPIISFDILSSVLISFHQVLISYYEFWYPIISFDILSSGFDILSSVLISSHIGLISFHPIVWYPFISPVCQSRPPTKPPVPPLKEPQMAGALPSKWARASGDVGELRQLLRELIWAAFSGIDTAILLSVMKLAWAEGKSMNGVG